MYIVIPALSSKRDFLGFNTSTNSRPGGRTGNKKSSTRNYGYTDNMAPGGNIMVSSEYIGSGGDGEISMPVKLNALRYGGYSAECILDRVEPNGNVIPEKEIATGQ